MDAGLAGVFIGKGCRLGNGVSIEANTTLRFTDIGDNTDIGANVVIGHDGFAVGRDQGNMIIPHLGLSALAAMFISARGVRLIAVSSKIRSSVTG